MHFLAEYGLFLLKAITIVGSILVILIVSTGLALKNKTTEKGKLQIDKLNDKFEKLAESIQQAVLPKQDLKKHKKELKKSHKAQDKMPDLDRKKCFVIEFDGDMKASKVESLQEEVSAILGAAHKTDEVLVKITSPGGMVNTYGLAASQLQRLRDNGLTITAAVDKVAASGGYLMACVAHKIIAAPFSIIGSIGVVAQLPNFNKLLKKNDIDFEMITAGKYKRTLTLFGENTDEARDKFKQDMEEIHELFQNFVHTNRKNLDLDRVATGEHWLGSKALELGLVDELITSEEYLQQLSKNTDLYAIKYQTKASLQDKLMHKAQSLLRMEQTIYG